METTTRSIVLSYESGKHLLDLLTGIHRIQEVSGKKRHTSVVSVAVVESTGSTVQVQDRDVKYAEYRSSGAGGQHRNKVATAIRATHIPTGTTVTAEDSKSQWTNKQSALRKLVQMLELQTNEKARNLQQKVRNEQIGSGTRPEASWNWTSWRDEVSIPGYGTRSMKQVLKGKFPF